MTEYTRRLKLTLITALLLLTSAPALADVDATERALTLDDLRTFTDVFNQVRTHFVREVPERELLNAAILGMLEKLDPYSEFLSIEEFRQFDNASKGRYGGIGVHADIRQGRIFFDVVRSGGPAALAGVLEGDQLLSVDDVAVKGRVLMSSLEALSGEPGTLVKLKVVNGTDEPREMQIKRAYIPVTTSYGELMADDVFYIHISHFNLHTNEEVIEIIENVERDLGHPPSGLILDLRGNPGGVVKPAVDIADAFLDEGLIVYTESRYDQTRLKIRATPGQWLADTPMVLLVDGNTASAAEVLAGALKDHRRAVVFGTQTFGKGSIQSILALHNGSALKLTTAHYFTPNGHVIHDRGITPDVLVPAVLIPDVLIPDVLIPDVLVPDVLVPEADAAERTGDEDTGSAPDATLERALQHLRELQSHQTAALP